MPGSIDLAVISLRADRILKALIDAANGASLRAHHAGRKRIRERRDLAHEAPAGGRPVRHAPDRSRLPRLMNPGLGVNASYWPNLPRPGNIALITQSGMIGTGAA